MELFDYYSLTENNITHAYLSQKGRKECYEFSRKMLAKKYFDNVYLKLKLLLKKLSKYKSVEIKNENALKEFNIYSDLLYEFCVLYKYLESPFQQATEEILLNRFNNQDQLIEVLSSRKSAKSFKLNSMEKHCLDSLLKLGYIKLQIHDNAVMFIGGMENIAKYLANKHSISINQALTLRKEEFISSLKGRKPDIELINQRLNGFILLKRNNKWLCLSGERYKEWKKKIKGTQSSKIQGQVAYKGKARGRVIIFQGWTGTIKVPKGSIFVTGMTNPQMVPYLRNASAIVTDEGGLTCHAAIVSREFKIPCIVGTGNATQILKDGDLVEVDAGKGVVKIIKRTK